MYAHLKVAKVQVELKLQCLRLTDTDVHAHIEKHRQARSTRGRGRESVNYRVIYSLRYLQTLDAACALIGPDHWLLLVLQGEAHMPLLCNRHFMSQANRRGDRVIYFRKWSKAKASYHTILDPECECFKIASSPDFIGMTPSQRGGNIFSPTCRL